MCSPLRGAPRPPAPLACRPARRYAPRRAAGFPPPPPRRRLRAKFIRGVIISFLSIYNEKRGFRPLMLCLYAAAPASLLLFALRGAVLVLSLWGRAAPYAPSVAYRIARCVHGEFIGGCARFAPAVLLAPAAISCSMLI